MFFLLYKSGATSGWITLVLTTLRFKTQAKKQKCNQSQLTDMTLPECKLNMNDSKAPQRRKHKLFVQLTNFTGNVMENYCRESIAPFDLIFQIILILFFMLYYLLELLKCSYSTIKITVLLVLLFQSVLCKIHVLFLFSLSNNPYLFHEHQWNTRWALAGKHDIFTHMKRSVLLWLHK